MLNEFFLYVLEDFHTGQSLGALKFTSDDPEFIKEAVELVYLAIPATPTTPELPATRAFSRELIAYIAAFLPVATYFKAVESRTSGLSDDQYTAPLETLNKRREVQCLFDLQDPSMFPALCNTQSRCDPRRRRRRGRRGCGCDAGASGSPGTGSVG